MKTLNHLWRSVSVRWLRPIAGRPRPDHAHRYRHLTSPVRLPRHVQRQRTEERLLAMACRRPF